MNIESNFAVGRHDFLEMLTVAADNQKMMKQFSWIPKKKSTQSYEKIKTLTDYGLASQRPVGGTTPTDARRELYTLTLTPTVNSLSTLIDQQALFTDQYSEYTDVGTRLGESMVATYVTDMTNIIGNGFTSGYTGADAAILFYSAHPNAGLATYSNVLAATALSESAAISLLVQSRSIKDPRGRVFGNTEGYWLWTGPGLEFTADKICQSTQVPGTNWNDKNVVAARLEPMVFDYLSSSGTTWGLISKQQDQHSVIRIDQMPLEVNQKLTREGHADVVVTQSWARGWSNGYGIYGCAGA